MGMKWTEEQSKVITLRDRNILVSAAAGSGKTAVLVQRILSKIMDPDRLVDIDRLLIMTFTRAAAGEMKERISNAIDQALYENPDNEHLQRQAALIHNAQITTIDGFCSYIIRNYFHMVELDPGYRTAEEGELKLLQEDVMKDLLEEAYEKADPKFLSLVECYASGKSDDEIRDMVYKLCQAAMSHPYPEEWLEECMEVYRVQTIEELRETSWIQLLWETLDEKLDQAEALTESARKICNEPDGPYFYDEALVDDLNFWREVRRCRETKDYDKVADILSGHTFAKLSAKRDSSIDSVKKEQAKELRDEEKEICKDLSTKFFNQKEEILLELIACAREPLEGLVELTLQFKEAFSSKKREKNLLDFTDMEHFALRILVEKVDGELIPTQAARELSEKYEEVMVDEYQDSNFVQELITTMVSGWVEKRKNIFMVGDVKQSIYRFRLADPRIFLQHYNTWPPLEDAEEHDSAKLLLSRNFRSRKEVLDATNFIFCNILSEEMGELDYGADEMLRLGANYVESSACGAEFHLLDLPTQTGEQRVRASEAEAAFVADYISNMLTSEFPIQDDKTKELRPVCEEDIVILMRSPSTRLLDYRRALEARGLHCAADAGEDFFASMEIAVLFALLQVIDNPRQDVPLIAVLRSPLFGFTPDELAAIRARQRTGDFYDALLLSEDIHSREFLDTLDALRNSAAHLSVRELLSEIYRRCNVLGIFGAMRRGAERKENLLAFLELSEDYARSGRQGLFDFVRTLREQLAEGEAGSMQTAHASSGVRIMSIHKSKGLEFPVVILSDLARRFSNMDFLSSVLVHPQLGLGPVCVDTQRHIQYPTVARQALERTLRREAKAEELRVLYVAMTRAKEKLVMVHTQANAKSRVADLLALSDCPVLPEAVDSGKCMGDWIMLPLLQRSEAASLRELAGQNGEGSFYADETPWTVRVHDGLSFVTPQRRPDDAPVDAAPPKDELPVDFAALSYRYPYAGQTAFPAKLTATQLKGRALDEEISENTTLPPRLRSLYKPKFLAGETTLTGAERGTALHLVMQDLDFFCEASEQSVREQVEKLRAQRKLTDEQASAVDVRAIVRFLRSDLAARIRKNAQTVRREYRFSLLRPVRDFATLDADDAVLLQGVVDCFFEEDGELVVVDFKTDRIGRTQIEERAEHYRPQLEAYSMALMRVMGKKVREKVLYFFSVGEEKVL